MDEFGYPPRIEMETYLALMGWERRINDSSFWGIPGGVYWHFKDAYYKALNEAGMWIPGRGHA